MSALNKETALRIDTPVLGITAQPDLAWSLNFTDPSTNPNNKNLKAVFFIGPPKEVKSFATSVASEYSQKYENWPYNGTEDILREDDDIYVVYYWVSDEVSVAGVLIFGDYLGDVPQGDGSLVALSAKQFQALGDFIKA